MSCQLVTNNGRNFELGGKNLLEVGQKSWFKLGRPKRNNHRQKRDNNCANGRSLSANLISY